MSDTTLVTTTQLAEFLKKFPTWELRIQALVHIQHVTPLIQPMVSVVREVRLRDLIADHLPYPSFFQLQQLRNRVYGSRTEASPPSDRRVFSRGERLVFQHSMVILLHRGGTFGENNLNTLISRGERSTTMRTAQYAWFVYNTLLDGVHLNSLQIHAEFMNLTMGEWYRLQVFSTQPPRLQDTSPAPWTLPTSPVRSPATLEPSTPTTPIRTPTRRRSGLSSPRTPVPRFETPVFMTPLLQHAGRQLSNTPNLHTGSHFGTLAYASLAHAYIVPNTPSSRGSITTPVDGLNFAQEALQTLSRAGMHQLELENRARRISGAIVMDLLPETVTLAESIQYYPLEDGRPLPTREEQANINRLIIDLEDVSQMGRVEDSPVRNLEESFYESVDPYAAGMAEREQIRNRVYRDFNYFYGALESGSYLDAIRAIWWNHVRGRERQRMTQDDFGEEIRIQEGENPAEIERATIPIVISRAVSGGGLGGVPGNNNGGGGGGGGGGPPGGGRGPFLGPRRRPLRMNVVWGFLSLASTVYGAYRLFQQQAKDIKDIEAEEANQQSMSSSSSPSPMPQPKPSSFDLTKTYLGELINAFASGDSPEKLLQAIADAAPGDIDYMSSKDDLQTLDAIIDFSQNLPNDMSKQQLLEKMTQMVHYVNTEAGRLMVGDHLGILQKIQAFSVLLSHPLPWNTGMAKDIVTWAYKSLQEINRYGVDKVVTKIQPSETPIMPPRVTQDVIVSVIANANQTIAQIEGLERDLFEFKPEDSATTLPDENLPTATPVPKPLGITRLPQLAPQPQPTATPTLNLQQPLFNLPNLSAPTYQTDNLKYDTYRRQRWDNIVGDNYIFTEFDPMEPSKAYKRPKLTPKFRMRIFTDSVIVPENDNF